jgi:hypothetical protein
VLYKGRKSVCKGRISRQFLLILLRSRKILSFEARVLAKTVSASPDRISDVYECTTEK